MIKMNYEFFLSKDTLPKNFRYPPSYIQYVAGDLPNLEPWHFFYKYLEHRFNGLKGRYPTRIIVPFARRSDNDDVACFDASESSDNPKVIIIHDWATEGWENRGECADFLSWVELAKEEARVWHEFWENKNNENL